VWPLLFDSEIGVVCASSLILCLFVFRERDMEAKLIIQMDGKKTRILSTKVCCHIVILSFVSRMHCVECSKFSNVLANIAVADFGANFGGGDV
jgi:hypothetical protein